jgi:hypothetical protein
MSETHGPDDRPSRPELDAAGEEEVRDLLRGALGPAAPAPDLTRGVQRKIRARSGGKFYADGWSTAKHPPLNTYLITSLLMLFVSCLIYALLAPFSGAPESAPAPAPVRVVPAE